MLSGAFASAQMMPNSVRVSTFITSSFSRDSVQTAPARARVSASGYVLLSLDRLDNLLDHP